MVRTIHVEHYTLAVPIDLDAALLLWWANAVGKEEAAVTLGDENEPIILTLCGDFLDKGLTSNTEL